MAKKNSRQPKCQAKHDLNVQVSSKGKFSTAAAMQSAGRKNREQKMSQSFRRQSKEQAKTV